jgi:hypothetical protein
VFDLLNIGVAECLRLRLPYRVGRMEDFNPIDSRRQPTSKTTAFARWVWFSK